MAKKKCPEFENHERWLVSYADMVTLLFAVFVVLYALKEEGAKTRADVTASMQESFNKPLDEIPIAHRIGPDEAGFGIFQYFQGNSAKPNLKDTYPSPRPDTKIIDKDIEKMKAQLEERFYGKNLFRDKTKPGQERIISITRNIDGFTLRLLAKHFYRRGSVRMKKSSLSEFGVVVKMLKKMGRTVIIQGHTDSVEPRNMTNWDLSALRATHVLRYMTQQHNFPPTMLSAAGYGDTRPMASNATAKGRALNRRIEIRVTYDQNASRGSVE